jgi:pimeloyl-ACP methyl ester carboxylesterase
MRFPQRVAGIVLVDPAMEWLTVTAARTRLLRGARHLSRVGGLLAHMGVVRACLALLTGGAPAVPRRFTKLFGPAAAFTLERLVGEVRKLPPRVHPIIQAHWCEPKCFQAMAEHLRVLERDVTAIAGIAPPPQIPLIVISSGAQAAEQLEAHRRLAGSSLAGRHMVARRSGHWIPFDEPELIVAAVRELTESARGAGTVATL